MLIKKNIVKLASKVSPKLSQKTLHFFSSRKFSKNLFILSFDCDTELDIKVSGEVVNKLIKLGITPVMAVPGELLERGHKEYNEIAKLGVEFINHGYLSHSSVDVKKMKYESTLFYNDLSEVEIFEDISKGDLAIRDVLDIKTFTFRTPHFGTFQSQDQLSIIYRSLERLNYKTSTSTSPFFNVRDTSFIEKLNINELPVSGSYYSPFSILDTFNYTFSRPASGSREDYINSLEAYYSYMKDPETPPIFLNLYGDPSHVYDWDDFFIAISRFSEFSISSFDEALHFS